VESQPVNDINLEKIDDNFKWVNNKGETIVLKIIRARDEPNALYWENIVIEPHELVVADRIVKAVIFVSIVVCFVLL